jgi:hypothetical protein
LRSGSSAGGLPHLSAQTSDSLASMRGNSTAEASPAHTSVSFVSIITPARGRFIILFCFSGEGFHKMKRLTHIIQILQGIQKILKSPRQSS